ncbi:MAG: hypothetical protein R2823_01375 [Acidimicrobiia bacterium]
MTKRRDPEGKRALFESPPIEIDEPLRDDPLIEHHTEDGHEALYSAGEHQPGTVVITCSRCEVRSRISLIESFVRILSISLWIPGRPYSRWIPCPSCQTRSWCRIDWFG